MAASGNASHDRGRLERAVLADTGMTGFERVMRTADVRLPSRRWPGRVSRHRDHAVHKQAGQGNRVLAGDDGESENCGAEQRDTADFGGFIAPVMPLSNPVSQPFGARSQVMEKTRLASDLAFICQCRWCIRGSRIIFIRKGKIIKTRGGLNISIDFIAHLTDGIYTPRACNSYVIYTALSSCT